MKYTKHVEEVNRVLTEKWDPIGVFCMCDEGLDAYTEYISYAKGITKMLRDDVHVTKIKQYLTMLRTKHIGLQPNDEADRAVAELLTRL